MLDSSNIITLGILSVLFIIITMFLNYIVQKKNKKQLDKILIVIFILILFWMLSSILQIVCMSIFNNINLIYFDYPAFISVCFLPVCFLFMAITFAKTKFTFKKIYCFLLIIPILSILLMWTNDLHHLIFKEYSIQANKNVYGSYFYIHYYYTLILYISALFIFMKYSIKNSGFFSRQAILIIIGALIPIITNLLEFLNIIPLSVYITPMTFAVTIICVSLAVFRFSFLKVTPIALQQIVDRISDSYVVLNENYEISDFNQTFITTFNIESSVDIRGLEFETLLKNNTLNVYRFRDSIKEVENNEKTESFELYVKKINKYFNVEITSIIVNKQFLGILVLFKDISQHITDMQMLKDSQDTMMENERLASLGQLIGGIAHNLKTPIMSIAGATEGLNDLVKEYDSSIGDPEVTEADHHDIARDMTNWIDKIKGYTEYMSDIITAVKGQAVTLAADEEVEFTLKELMNRVDILMRHELKNALVYLNVSMQTDENTVIEGDVNSLVQVINNMISNSIQAYKGKSEQNIDMIIDKTDNNIVISIRDYAGGLPEKVKNKLFKEMITTKGKNGTGLGLYMSYSNIKARFNGDINFDTNSEGTTFNIILPL